MLVGDFVYSRAFQMMVSVDRMRVLEVLADATNVIAEGEVLQLMNMHDADITVPEYLRVIRFKTAKLFEASARLGAVLAEADTAVEEACAAYGRSLGTAFQLVDDLLDYEGRQRNSARTSETTFARASRPSLCCWPWRTAARRSAPSSGKPSSMAKSLAWLTSWRSSAEPARSAATRDAARREAEHAASQLSQLAPSDYREALLEFCVRSVDRSF